MNVKIIATRGRKYSLDIMVDDEVVFRHQPSEAELRAFLDRRGWSRSGD